MLRSTAPRLRGHGALPRSASQICINYRIFAVGYEGPYRTIAAASPPPRAGTLLGVLKERHCGAADIAEYPGGIAQLFRRRGARRHISEAENSTRDDAVAGRRHRDRSGDNRPLRVVRRPPGPGLRQGSSQVGFGTKRYERDRGLRCSIAAMKSAEPRFTGRDRKPEFVGEQHQTRLDPEHIRGDEAGRACARRQRVPEVVRAIPSDDDLDAGFARIADPRDHAADAGKRRLADHLRRIGLELSLIHI